MTILLESPLPALVVGVLAEAALAFTLFATGRRAITWAMGGVLAVTAALVFLEWFVVTDVERIHATLHDTAAEVQSGDVQAVLKRISPSATKMRSEARWMMQRFRINPVSVRGTPKIQVDRQTTPPQAQATFNVFLKVDDISYPRLVIARLRLEEDQWRFYHYKTDHPLSGEGR